MGNRFGRLVKDYERYAQTLAGLHVVAFACLMMKQVAHIAAGSSQPLGDATQKRTLVSLGVKGRVIGHV